MCRAALHGIFQMIMFTFSHFPIRVCLNDPNVPNAASGWIWASLCHYTLIVRASDSDQKYLVDIGFGINTLFSPIPFADSAVVHGITEQEVFSLHYGHLPGVNKFTFAQSTHFFYRR